MSAVTLGAADRRWRALRRTAAIRGARWLILQAALGIGGLAVAAAILWPATRWVIHDAEWGVVAANLKLFAVGPYPKAALWRPVACLVLLSGLLGATVPWTRSVPRDLARILAAALVGIVVAPGTAGLLQYLEPTTLDSLARGFAGGRTAALAALAALAGSYALSRTILVGRTVGAPAALRALAVAWLALPAIALAILAGAGLHATRVAVGLPGWGDVLLPAVTLRVGVSPGDWGGLLLTLVLAVVSIAASFVLGLVLALGRRSPLPLVRAISVGTIELVRGVPLITVLFMALVMVPLVLPSGAWTDPIVRAMAGFTVFSAAYVAEDVRGGLAAVGRGQYEAARALGLGVYGTYRLVVLPQALRVVIPALVGQFISLFKDTALIGLLGLAELLRTALRVVAQPEWRGLYRESLIFVAAVYFVMSFAMAHTSRRLETPRSRR